MTVVEGDVASTNRGRYVGIERQLATGSLAGLGLNQRDSDDGIVGRTEISGGYVAIDRRRVNLGWAENGMASYEYHCTPTALARQSKAHRWKRLGFRDKLPNVTFTTEWKGKDGDVFNASTIKVDSVAARSTSLADKVVLVRAECPGYQVFHYY